MPSAVADDLEAVTVRNRQVMWVAAAAALGWACVSCGGPGAGLSSVRGKVVCDGQPAAGAVLFFHRQPGGPNPPEAVAGIIPSAVVADDGSFNVESHPLGSGAAPGKYNVLVQWTEDQNPAEARAASTSKTTSIKGKTVTLTKHDKLKPIATDRLKGRYSDPSKPLREVEVKPGQNDLGTLELTLKN
jgi:hypothetical protein